MTVSAGQHVEYTDNETVTYHTTPSDWWTFHLYLLRNEPQLQRGYLNKIAIYGLLAALVAWIWGHELVPGIAGFVGGLGAGIIFDLLSTRRNVSRWYRTNPHTQEDHEARIEPDGLHTHCAHSTSTMAWIAFTKAVQNRRYVYLFTAPCNAVIIPKTSFSSEANANAFVVRASSLIRAAHPARA